MIAIWTNHLSLGNRTIDSAHEHILSMINRVDYLIRVKDGAALTETLKLLEDSLREYSEAEEKIAQAIKVDFTQHNLAHQQLLNDLQCMRNMLAEKNGMWSDREVEFFIIPWSKRFIQHIKDEGETMKVVLGTHFYDFKPD
ncbi:MAG TPA: hemerythrin domain-containing protein [Gallionella sp.]|nr:hemerythrin domain-containing protein [Gallionella sp.]